MLDIGCGNDAHGTVNLDIKKPKRKTQNFVLADAYSLPFRDNAFQICRANHVFEHLRNPLKALWEWHRVTKNQLIIRVPSQYWRDRTRDHYFTWNPDTLENLVCLVFPKVHVSYTKRMFKRLSVKTTVVNALSKVFGFWIEIEAVAEKRKS
jgi:ubiquinone/menaquinone biosynthesis C-methylase UbiE